MAVTLIGARYWTRGSGHVLRPASALDDDRLATIPEGRAVEIIVTTADAPKARQFYFGLVSKLVEAGVWKHRDEADTDLMVRAGRIDRVLVSSEFDRHTVRLSPVSKSGWGIPEWREYLNAIVPIVVGEILPGVTWPKTREAIERYCGVRLAEAIGENAA